MRFQGLFRLVSRLGLGGLLLLLPTATASSTTPPLILRLRFPDGAVSKVALDARTAGTTRLQDVLDQLPTAQGWQAAQPQAISQRLDASATLDELGLKHGSLLALVSSDAEATCSSSSTTGGGLQKKNPTQLSAKESSRWDPYPELAKNYHQAVRRQKQRRTALSYGDLARVQAELHTVEPQATGAIQRVYMCRTSAEVLASGNSGGGALLLGTVQRERKDVALKKRPKTSLSSTTAEDDFLTAAKVHAVWNFPASASSNDNGAALWEQASAALRVADWLGLKPVGWIFTYSDTNRHAQEGLPVHGPDIQRGAELQIQSMRKWGRDEGHKFVTLAMDASTGATEAFSLSDVAVQMTAEGVWADKADGGRFANTTTLVLVDGKETKSVDTVLCLVNTALLSHEGTYADGLPSAVKKKGAGLSKKTKKRLAAALSEGDDHALLSTLTNFAVLVTLTERLDLAEAESLVTTVRKFARGQKRGTALDAAIQKKLAALVEA
jgi:hypothetical protein